MLQFSTQDRRKGKKADLLPVKVLRVWHSLITDLLRSWHHPPMDFRQLWFSPVFFGSKCVKIRELHCSLPRWHSHSTQRRLCPDHAGQDRTGSAGTRPNAMGLVTSSHLLCHLYADDLRKGASQVPADQSPGTNREAGWQGQLGSLLWHMGPNTPLGYSFPWLWITVPNSHKHPAHNEDKGI